MTGLDEGCVCQPDDPCYFHFVHGGVPVIPAPSSGPIRASQIGLFTGEPVPAAWVDEDGRWTCARCGRVVVAERRPRRCGCARRAP